MTLSMADAMAAVPVVSPDQAREMVSEGALLVDVREPQEITASGKLAGAINIPRGLIETVADIDSPAHDPAFVTDRPIVLYCAAGARSAMAGVTLKSLGYDRVYNLGGFQAAASGGYEVEAG